MLVEIPIQILEVSGVFILFGILTVAFLYLLGEKVDDLGISFLLALILSFVFSASLYGFDFRSWYSHFGKAMSMLINQAGLIYLLIPIFVGLTLVFLGDYFSEKMSEQQYRSFYHALYGMMLIGVVIISPDIGFIFLSISLMLFLIVEYLRLSNDENRVTAYLKKILNKPIRGHEKKRYVAGFSFICGMLFVILFLPKGIVLGSGLILSFGDPSAALIGKKYGKHGFRHNPDKSLEGSLAMFIVSFASLYVLSLYFSYISLIVALFASLSAVILESFDLKSGDNLLIPIVAGIVMRFLAV